MSTRSSTRKANGTRRGVGTEDDSHTKTPPPPKRHYTHPEKTTHYLDPCFTAHPGTVTQRAFVVGSTPEARDVTYV